ncbi:NTP transferase domain-containing protein [Streptomyces sp. NPDC017941]|uniref:nucleotidyltransferase family protein n=1 Tax=Streptomyces sp. NPDC017941 TaxID=3365018 RepID=UPI0037B57299
MTESLTGSQTGPLAGPRTGPLAGPPSPSAPAASSEVVGLLLAAGGGRRLGGCPKALLEHRGELFVERAARALRNGGCTRVHIVLGATADVVREQAKLPGCTLVDNPDWHEGMGSSLRAGLASLRGSGAGAALVCLVDQPGVGAAAVSRVRAAFRSTATLAAATYGGERGHPVLFGADHWDGIAVSATGDRGARAYLGEFAAAVTAVECGDVADPYDIDTMSDLERLE